MGDTVGAVGGHKGMSVITGVCTSANLSVCLGAVHVVQHLPSPQPLQRLLHCHHTLVLQQHNTWARKRGRDTCTQTFRQGHTDTTVRLSFCSGPILSCGTAETGRLHWKRPYCCHIYTHAWMQCMHFQSSQTGWDQTSIATH